VFWIESPVNRISVRMTSSLARMGPGNGDHYVKFGTDYLSFKKEAANGRISRRPIEGKARCRRASELPVLQKMNLYRPTDRLFDCMDQVNLI
jgi:hypothetical protein